MCAIMYCMESNRFKANVGDSVIGGYTIIAMDFWEAKTLSGKYKKLPRTWFYICQHECGRTRKFLAHQLDKDKQPCKLCMAGKLRMKETEYLIINTEYRKYKSSAKSKGYSFELDLEDFARLIKASCNYCGQEPYNVKSIPSNRTKREIATALLGGIDRLDSSMGYIAGNVVPACWICNRAKSTMSVSEWLKMVQLWYARTGARTGTDY